MIFQQMTIYGGEKVLYSPYAPTVDGVTLLDDPLTMLQSGRMHKKDVLLGKIFIHFGAALSSDAIVSRNNEQLILKKKPFSPTFDLLHA